MTVAQSAAVRHREPTRHRPQRRRPGLPSREPKDALALVTVSCVECGRVPEAGKAWMDSWACAQIPVLRYPEADDPPPRCPDCQQRLR